MPLDVDTSSYPKPSAPQNPLDIAGKLGGLQSQALQIDSQKLGLLNDRMNVVARDLSSLLGKDDLSRNDVISHYDNLTKIGAIPPALRQKAVSEIPNSNNPEEIRKHVEATISRGQEIQNAINWHARQPGMINTPQQQQPVGITNLPSQTRQGRAIVTTGPAIPTELPPGTQIPDQDPSKPSQSFGVQPTPMPLPIQGQPNVVVGQPNIAPKDQGRLPIQNPIGAKPVQTVPASQLYNKPPAGPISALPPGVSEAETITAGASGKHLATERERSANFQREIFPLMEAIPALEELGTKGTGPGSETLNNMKSFILTMMPGVKETDPTFANVPTFDKAKKYLTDFVNQNSAGGTNDRLAASFAGNPSVGISNAAAQDVAKSAMALARMRQALQLQWEKEKLPASQFSRWMVNKVQETDPRAFGLDMMDEAKVKKLYATVDKNPIESKRFDASLDIAHNLGFITPPSKKR